MKVVAAYLLAVLGGNTSPCADDLNNILNSVGAEADDDRIQLLLSEVKGRKRRKRKRPEYPLRRSVTGGDDGGEDELSGENAVDLANETPTKLVLSIAETWVESPLFYVPLRACKKQEQMVCGLAASSLCVSCPSLLQTWCSTKCRSGILGLFRPGGEAE
ncbi:hypothetical protein CsSME_00014979 [Camellia sinensis var. sinensis]